MDSLEEHNPHLNSDSEPFATTLIHTVVMRNNIDSIKYSMDADDGYDINAENSLGDAALLITALKCNNFEAAKILLDSNAEVCIADLITGKTALELLMTKSRQVIEEILPRVMDNLKRSNFDTETLVELLVTADCPFKYILTMNDAQISRAFLERNPSGDYRSAINVAVNRADLNNVKLILRYGDESARLHFIKILFDLSRKRMLKLWKLFVEQLCEVDVASEGVLVYLYYMFRGSDKEYLQMLLNLKIDARVREKFGIDLRTCIFENQNVDAVDILKNHQDFDVNAAGYEGKTALHFAASNRRPLKNIRFLLDSGVDMEIKDNCEETALFHCIRMNDENHVKALLEYGADVQAVANMGFTTFDYADHFGSFLIEFLIAQLAICNVQGTPIKQAIHDLINRNEDYTQFYETRCQQLRALKICDVVESVTFFHLLTEKIERLYCHLRNRDIMPILEKYQDQQELYSLYYSTMKNKLIKISNIHRFRCEIANVISDTSEKLIDFDHLVIREISKYLTHWDIGEFIKAVEYIA